MKSQNDLRIMETLSPKSKEAMAKQMALVRIREMQDRLSSLPPPGGVNITATDLDVASNLTNDDTNNNDNVI